ncbi:unnamed protein product [Thlaspi arvense]|uniref:Translation elongation factor EFG/EF2 domain-containing protein n=1 Tax=Thlaspi arvense TaxID=13288 RepID=A0AAU9SRL5_THLAR|nr:unnamed protein product [Thlaspi arvense]
MNRSKSKFDGNSTLAGGGFMPSQTTTQLPDFASSSKKHPESKGSLDQFLAATIDAAQKAGQVIRKGFYETKHVEHKDQRKRNYCCKRSICNCRQTRVNFRETITQRAEFDYLHKKQSGGAGQYGRVTGYLEQLPLDFKEKFEFENMIVGQAIPSGFIPAIEKGFKEAANSGSLIGHPVENLIIVLTNGASHAVDSGELAFKMAAIYAFRLCYTAARSVILEPVMLAELKVPTDFQDTKPVSGNVRTELVKFIADRHANLMKPAARYYSTLKDAISGKRRYTLVKDAADMETGVYGKHLPCFGCGIGWFS